MVTTTSPARWWMYEGVRYSLWSNHTTQIRAEKSHVSARPTARGVLFSPWGLPFSPVATVAKWRCPSRRRRAASPALTPRRRGREGATHGMHSDRPRAHSAAASSRRALADLSRPGSYPSRPRADASAARPAIAWRVCAAGSGRFLQGTLGLAGSSFRRRVVAAALATLPLPRCCFARSRDAPAPASAAAAPLPAAPSPRRMSKYLP